MYTAKKAGILKTHFSWIWLEYDAILESPEKLEEFIKNKISHLRRLAMIGKVFHYFKVLYSI